jgi:diketogulonate reductase-like aldo/keto reductase
MEQKPLGNTGVMVPEIGLGVWKYKGGAKPLQRGIELGASLVDTAEIYKTEEAVGQAIVGLRDRVFIATKVSGDHLRYDDLMRAAEGSLRRLVVEVIDLYQVHWPNPATPIAETMRALGDLVDRGLVRHIGVSNFSVAEMEEAQAAATNHPIVSNQVLYSLKERGIEEELLPYCQANQITVIAYTPLADGALTHHPRFREYPGLEVLEAVAAQAERTMAQVALNWCTSHPNVIAIPKSNSVERTEANCHASGWRLSAEQVELLDAAFMS